MSQSYKIVGMLERIDEQSMYLAPATTYATTQEAASLIRELAEALETIAGNWIDPETMKPSDPVASDLQKIAASALSKLKEA